MALVASLRETVQKQAQELEALQAQLSELSARSAEVNFFSLPREFQTDSGCQADQLRTELDEVKEELKASEEKRQDVEKEQEDLLVLLDELNGKRRRDKQLLRTAGMDVSEDEEEEDEEDEE